MANWVTDAACPVNRSPFSKITTRAELARCAAMNRLRSAPRIRRSGRHWRRKKRAGECGNQRSAAKNWLDRMLRVFAFVDAGNVWDEKQTPRLSDIRYSYGLGLTWISPIGPLKFSWGFPIVKKAGDAYRRFEFTIGTSF